MCLSFVTLKRAPVSFLGVMVSGMINQNPGSP